MTRLNSPHISCPILEHNPSRDAITEPSKIIKPRDMPEHAVICFFREAVDKVIAEHNTKALVNNHWEDGPHPIYEIAYHGQRLALFHPGVGAPIAANLLEEAIAFGCRKFIARGGRGIPYRLGKAWTTDAPYRETPNKIARRKEDSCVVVEMEAAGMMASKNKDSG
jgi:uridine phosphorylase